MFIPIVNDLVRLLLYAAPCFKTPKHLHRGQKDTRWVYFDVDTNVLWSTVNNDLPKLATLLEEVLAGSTPTE